MKDRFFVLIAIFFLLIFPPLFFSDATIAEEKKTAVAVYVVEHQETLSIPQNVCTSCHSGHKHPGY